MDDDNEAAHRAWVLWLNGDKDMPLWGVALMHDLVTCFYKEATGHERLRMIGRFPLLVELHNVAWWVSDPLRVSDARLTPYFDQMPTEQRLELTALRGELERVLLRKRGIDV
jgi:hypothetical protein